MLLYGEHADNPQGVFHARSALLLAAQNDSPM